MNTQLWANTACKCCSRLFNIGQCNGCSQIPLPESDLSTTWCYHIISYIISVAVWQDLWSYKLYNLDPTSSNHHYWKSQDPRRRLRKSNRLRSDTALRLHDFLRAMTQARTRPSGFADPKKGQPLRDAGHPEIHEPQSHRIRMYAHIWCHI